MTARAPRLLASLLGLSLAAAPRPAATVTYLACEGFLIEAGGRKALVDALFTFPQYLPSHDAARTARMIQGRPPFDRVDLLLVTHPHRDHFDAGMVAAFLRQHPETTLVAGRETVEALRNQEGFEAFQARTRGIAQRAGESTRVDLPGIRVDTLQLHHAGGYSWNLAFSVDLGGFRFFHTGDVLLQEVATELRGFPFLERRPDALFLEHWDGSPESKALIAARIQPTHLVPMHFGEPEYSEEVRKSREAHPSAVFFEQGAGLESRVLEARDTAWKPEGDYLDQPPPGPRPRVFARGLVSTENMVHSAPVFSPDGDEVFWSLWRRPGIPEDRELIMTARRSQGAWSKPAVASFSGRYTDGGPAFSPDGSRLFFYSNRPLHPGGPVREYDLWRVDRKGEVWGEPACLGLLQRFPELGLAASPSVAASGNLYFVGRAEGSTKGYAILRSAWVDGQHRKPELLPAGINAPGSLNGTPFIAPDENYLLFSSDRRDPGRDTGDLWISRRQADGRWGDPVLLPPTVNSVGQDRFPAVSPDGRMLFFTRTTPARSGDVYWVDARSSLAPHTPDQRP